MSIIILIFNIDKIKFILYTWLHKQLTNEGWGDYLIDLNSDKSIYIQIAEIVENDILLENLKDGDQAPSTNEFSKIYGINPATARKGLNILIDEDVLFKKRGLGMFVSQGARKIVLKKRQDIFLNERLPEIMKEANRLEISKAEVLDYINMGREET